MECIFPPALERGRPHLPSASLSSQYRQRIYGPDLLAIHRQNGRVCAGKCEFTQCVSGHGPDAEAFERGVSASPNRNFSEHHGLHVRDSVADPADPDSRSKPTWWSAAITRTGRALRSSLSRPNHRIWHRDAVYANRKTASGTGYSDSPVRPSRLAPRPGDRARSRPLYRAS